MKKVTSIILAALFVAVCFCGCGHKHEMATKVIKKATCEKEGIIKYYCKTCSYSYEETEESKGHDYDDGETTVSPSCTEYGKIKYTCKSCGKTETEDVPPEHDFKEISVDEASCTLSGERVLECTLCGETKTEEIKAKGHTFINNTCTVCEAVRVTNIDADSWYYYKDLDIVYVQNCDVTIATPTSKGAWVTYYPVCKNCHIRSSLFKSSVPEYNYPITKNYICNECGTTTTVKLRIAY